VGNLNGTATSTEDHRVRRASSDADYRVARRLFERYAAALGIDLGFQDFDRELATLPGDYAAPRGALLFAECGGDAIGCVALRPLGGSLCEMKRLYVVQTERGRGFGRVLAEAAIREAGRIGYSHMRLDTLPSMVRAIALYRSLGFREIAPYRNNPIAGVSFFELALGGERRDR
jgi:putative acetyltransferase